MYSGFRRVRLIGLSCRKMPSTNTSNGASQGSTSLTSEESTAQQSRKRLHRREGAEILRCKKLSDDALIPTRGSDGAAGYDLYSAHDSTIASRGRALIKTDIAIALPPGCYGRVAPRSGLALKHGLDVGAGVVDPDYRGNVGVVLFNLSDTDYKVKKGDRIAQLVLEKFLSADVEEVNELDDTDRSAGGFGSTGQ